MKTSTLFFVVVCLCGCALFKAPTVPEKARRVASVVEIAAFTGGSYWLIDHPADKGKLQQVALQIGSLDSTNGLSVASLQQIVQSLPIKELKTEKASLAIGAAILLYETQLGEIPPVDQNSYAALVARGLKKGLQTAVDSRP